MKKDGWRCLMRLDWLKLRNFKNLKSVDINFDEAELSTVIVGENGAGKSNVIEALVTIFRDLDLNEATSFHYAIKYRCRRRCIVIDNGVEASGFRITVDGEFVSKTSFHSTRDEYLPSNVFGYYSGSSRRMEALFDKHQQRYYRRVISPDSEQSDIKDVGLRRLFYSRSAYGQLALLTYFAFGDPTAQNFLQTNMAINGFDSALIVLRKPRWAAAKPTKHQLKHGDPRFWYSAGLVRGLLESLWSNALAPIAGEGREHDDYRVRPADEEQVYVFIENAEALRRIAAPFGEEKTFFALLETLDISDLIREVRIWVRVDNTTDEIPFHEISDGEKQLLSVLGLMRFTGADETLFLLDEPDTHLNPAWKWGYLELVRQIAQASGESHIIMTTHDPLTLGGLMASQVQVMAKSADGQVTATRPDLNPRGLGFTSILTQIFGLKTTLDPYTQDQLEKRNALLRIVDRSQADEAKLIALSDQLRKLGFILEDREPEYELFIRAWEEVHKSPDNHLTPEEIRVRNEVARRIAAEIAARRGAAT